MATWKDRILPAGITTPDGKRYEFDYEDVEQNISKNVSKYRFADMPGTLVQDFGLGETSFPLTIYFTGDNCDKTADAFTISASLRGICLLEHPKYGVKNVIIEEINRKDNLKSSYNQVTFVLGITETILTEIPASDAALKNDIASSQDELAAENSKSFADQFKAALNDAAKARARILNNIRKFKNAVKSITNAVNDATEAFNEMSDYIEDNIDFLLTAPLQLAGALQRLYAAPALFEASVKLRVKGYESAYKGLIDEITDFGTQDAKNKKAEQALILIGIISAYSSIYTNPDVTGETDGYQTRAEAINNAQILIDNLVNVQNSQDLAEQNSVDDDLSLKFIAPDQANLLAKNVVSQSVKWLIAQSFNLNQEIKIELDRDYTIIDLCYKVYSTTDNDAIDFLIQTNGLTSDMLIIIPKGTIIKYYA